MTKSEVLNTIERERLVPIIRTATTAAAKTALEFLDAGGLKVAEVTLTIPNAADLIADSVSRHPDLLIGAGTVLSAEQVDRCIDAGARFVVSPVLAEEVIAICRKRGVVVFGAGLTPTEINAAWQAGADAVKVFPCNAVGGASFIRSMKSVFPMVRLIPTGGITAENVREHLDAGAFAAGAGSDLLPSPLMESGGSDAINKRIRAYVDALA